MPRNNFFSFLKRDKQVKSIRTKKRELKAKLSTLTRKEKIAVKRAGKRFKTRNRKKRS